MENFVVMELARQLTWSEQRGTLHHYRTKDGAEIDAVIETPDGRINAIEVKAGSSVRTEDLSGLRGVSTALGDRFVAGHGKDSTLGAECPSIPEWRPGLDFTLT